VFKSLRFRLIASFILIVIITLVATGVALYARLGGYRDELTAGSLKQVAAPIYYNLTVPSAFTNTERGGVRLREQLLEYIRVQREETGVIILYVDAQGTVIEEFADDTQTFVAETFEVPPAPARGPNFSELPEGTYTTSDGADLLYVTVPMPQSVRNQPAGIHGIVVALPVSAGPDVYRDLRQRLIFAGIIGSATALVAGFLLWLSLYRPLGRVTSGIRAVARGSYRERVPVSGPSEVQALARDVNTMADSVEASQTALREFLANVSHELKTPLTSIRGFSQAMLDGTLETPEERTRAARVIDTESRRLLHLVGELLDLSRIESGQQQMALEPVRLGELLAHIGDVFGLRAEEAGVALVIAAAEDVMVNADFDRIEQVLGNLVDNAMRHSSRGGRIEIGTRPGGRRFVELYVRDGGPGIRSEELPHVFDRFYRSAEETAGSGAGLGLAISKEIVRAHGGEIRAEAPAGGGSVFAFSLPLAPSEREGTSTRRTPDQRVTQAGTRP
jgi:signal transduction histidine kinase